jgi:putative ABC transport system permease protein
MRIRNALFLFRIRLRSRLVQELLAVAGIAVGVGLVFAALVANTSLTGSMRQLTETIVGDATLQVASRGPGGFDAKVAAEVRRLDGVETAAPLLEVRANVLGPEGRESVVLIGGDPSFAELGGTVLNQRSGAALVANDAIALPTPLADSLGISFGQRLRIEVNSRVVPATLSVRLDEAEIGALIHHPVALAPLPNAQAFSGMQGKISRILVKPRAGRERDVEAQLNRLAGDRLDVGAADAEVDIFEQAAYPTNQSTALFSVFSALIGFLFAFSAVLLTVPQRRRFINDIRLAGHDTTAVVQLLLLDALILGAAGSLLGLFVGDQLSRHLFDSTPGYLAAAFAVGSQRIVTWESVAVAASAGIAAACFALFVPLRDVLAYRPNRRRRPAPRLAAQLDIGAAAVAGLGLAAVTTLAFLAPDAALVGMAILTLALLSILPILLRAVARACEVATRGLRSVVPTVALQELASTEAKSRTLAVAATGAIAVFATVAIGGAHADLERGLDASARDIDRNADIWVTFGGKANTLATTPFDELSETTAAIRDIPGVHDASSYRGSFFDIGDRRAWTIAPPISAIKPIPPTQILDGDLATASDRLRRGGWIALSQAIADDLDVGVGDRMTLPSTVPTDFRVAAVTTNLGWPPGAVVLNARDYAKAWGSPAASAIHVETDGDSSPASVAAAIRRELGPTSPLRVETKGSRVERHYALTQEGLSRMTQISAMVLVSAILAMVVAMGGMIWQRRRTFAALKVQGFSERELWSALIMESAVLLGTATLAGAVFGLFGQVLLSRALEAITGFPVFYSLAAVVAVAVLGIATLVAVTMLAVPGWLAVRVAVQRGGSR